MHKCFTALLAALLTIGASPGAPVVIHPEDTGMAAGYRLRQKSL